MATPAEKRRLETLRGYGVLDTISEMAFDDLIKLAAHICGAPIALISLVDEHRQWFKAKVGVTAEETSRDVSFCAHAMLQQELFIVPDATKDVRFATNALVTADPHIRFYAGAPLIAPNGEGLGTLCVIDRVSRTLEPSQEEALRILGRQVMTQLELRRQTEELRASEARLAVSERRFRGIFDSTFNAMGLLSPDGVLLEANKTALELIRAREEDVLGLPFAETPWWTHSTEEQAKLREGIQRAARGETIRFETSHLNDSGQVLHVDFTLKPIFDDSGQVVHLVPEGRDITERKAAEENSAWLATFPVRNPNPIVELDFDSEIVHYANPGAIRLLPGLLKLAGRHPYLANLEEAKTRLREGDTNMVRREIMLGDTFYTQIVTYVPEANRYRVYGSDITERKRTEAALKASEARYHSLFENMLEGYCYCQVLREEGRVTDFIYLEVNSAFEPLTGLKNVAGRKVSEVIPGVQESNPDLFETYERVTSSGHPERYETFLPTLDIWFSVAIYSPDSDHFVAVFDNITERKQSAAAIEDVSTRLQLATMASGVGVWDWDLQNDGLVWDDQMYALYGLEPGEVSYEMWAALVDPEDLPVQADILQDTILRRGRSERKFRIRRADDGSIRVIQTAEMIFTDSEGEPVRMVGVNRDVTDLETAAASLGASEELLRQFIKYTPAAIAMLDTEMRYVQASDRWLRDYHLEGRDIIGLSHYEVFPDMPERWKAIHQRVLQGAVEHCDEDPFPRAGGGTEWLQWEARPWRRAGGEIGGLVFYTQVITPRKEAEAQMRESEERFRGAFENAPIGMAMVSITGRWMRVNRALCEIVGRTKWDLLSCTFQQITHPEDLNSDLEYLRELIDGSKEHYTMEKRYLHKTGRIVWVLLAVTVVRDANALPVHFVAQIEDISERREAAARVQASLEEKEVLLREIHHRVKNNLQVITSLLQLGSGYLRDPQDAEIFKECQARIHAMGLVHDRLYRSGNLATINFSEHLRELTALIVRGQSHAPERIRVVVESELIEVNLDIAIPLGLITAELITNAYKHAFRDRPAGVITVRLAKSAERELTLCVEDDGVGLPADFDPAKARSLGLRLIRALSGQLRGKFTIASAEPGSRLELKFPIEGAKPSP